MLNRRTGTSRGEVSSTGDGNFLVIFWRTFIKDNKVIPPILAVVALLIFSWVVAGAFLGGPEETASSQQGLAPSGEEIAQSDPDASDPEANAPALEIENPNAESFAAYESKDPFRSIFTPASAGAAGSGDEDPDGGGAGNGGVDSSGDGTGGTDSNEAGTGGGDTGRDNGGRTPADRGGGGGGEDGTQSPRTDPTRSPAEAQYDTGDDGGVATGRGRDGSGDGDANPGDGSSGGSGNGNGRSGNGSESGSGQNGSSLNGSGRTGGGSDDLFDSGGTLPDPGR